ncbi:MAG TPA: AI-2E family transporter [Verrucomicrobia bacterium]|nr:MAG: AI-2E family transporter [Lentisphaerae bacterium GWF2_57_35]HBA84174.1 AI-2E family transporter [Verrucomicrobiota bacterium]
MTDKLEVKSISVGFALILAAALFGFIQTFSLLSPILLSFLLILLISLAFNPVISRMRALMGGRKIATGLVVTAFLAVIALTGLVFFGPMNASIAKISEQLPGYWERLQKPLIRIEKQSVLSEEKLQAEVTTEMAQAAMAAGTSAASTQSVKPAPAKVAKESGALRSRLSQLLQDVAGSFTAVAVNTAQILVVLATVFFGVTLTLMNPRPIVGALFSLVPERHHALTLAILQRIGNFVPGWAGATLLGMLTIGLLVFLLMWPIFGMMDALALGLIAGILEAIPFLGPLLSATPALLFAVGKGGLTPLWVVLAYLTVQALENNVILPLIMARSMKLHPVAVLFSMLLCVASFGVLGVLVAAPLVAIVDILHDELYRKRFLPAVTDADLDRLARKALHEKLSEDK